MGFFHGWLRRRKRSKALELEKEGCLDWVPPTEVDLSIMVPII